MHCDSRSIYDTFNMLVFLSQVRLDFLTYARAASTRGATHGCSSFWVTPQVNAALAYAHFSMASLAYFLVLIACVIYTYLYSSLCGPPLQYAQAPTE